MRTLDPLRRVLPAAVALVAAAAIAAGAPGCRGAPPSGRAIAGPRLVVLYAPCTVNKSYLAPYDSSVAYTPHLADFVRRGLVFERHQTETGQSGTAFASIFSGTQAPHHGIFSHPNRIDDEVHLITEAFAEAGYDVHAWLAHQMASPGLGYAQGVGSRRAFRGPLRAEHRVFRRLLTRLRADPSYRAFVVTNFTVTHGAYKTHWLDEFCESYPHDCNARTDRAAFDRYVKTYRNNMRLLGWDLPAARRKLRLDDDELANLAAAVETVYKSTVSHLDRLFGDVVRAIEDRDLFDDALIAFTSDHGEILYRENAKLFWTHGFQLAPEVIDVPWILSGPRAGVPAGRYAGTTRSMDVFPTLAGLAGVQPADAGRPDAERGHDLARAVRGQVPAPRLLAFSHTPLFQKRYWDRFRRYRGLRTLFPEQLPELMWVAVRDEDLFVKLRRSQGSTWETPAFDLASDPGETRDIFDPHDPRHAALVEQLRAYKARIVPSAREAEGTVPHERSIKLLQRLGYID